MKKFLHLKWFMIPLIVVLVLAITAGGVMAAFAFLKFSTVVTVDEPLYIEYNLQGAYGGDALWHPLGDEDSLTIEGSAGDDFDLLLRINNRANNSLIVNTLMTGNVGQFICTGFPDGTTTVLESDGQDVDSPEWEGPLNIKVKGDAPAPGTYTINFAFTRE